MRKRLDPALAPILSAVVILAFGGNIFAITHVVNQVGLTFVPSTVTIEVGDTVEWRHSTDFHTVTSETGPADPEVGMLFDSPLDNGTPVFSFTFIQPEDFPYFCRPHFSLGMIGIVIVNPPTAVESGSNTSWGRVKMLYR